jgi:hypothetical protein
LDCSSHCNLNGDDDDTLEAKLSLQGDIMHFRSGYTPEWRMLDEEVA